MKKFLAAVRAWCGDHKKLTVMFVGIGISLIPDTVVTQEQKKEALATILVFLGAQGVADHGKEAAKIQAAAGVPATLQASGRSATLTFPTEAIAGSTPPANGP